MVRRRARGARMPRGDADAPRAGGVGSRGSRRKSRCGCRKACIRAEFHFFAVGIAHRELLPVGPAWSRPVAMEHAPSPTKSWSARKPPQRFQPMPAMQLPDGCWLRSRRATAKNPADPRRQLSPETLTRCLSAAIREHVLGGGALGASAGHDRVHPLRGHRRADRAGGRRRCRGRAARRRQRVEAACDQQGVAFWRPTSTPTAAS